MNSTPSRPPNIPFTPCPACGKPRVYSGAWVIHAEHADRPNPTLYRWASTPCAQPSASLAARLSEPVAFHEEVRTLTADPQPMRIGGRRAGKASAGRGTLIHESAVSIPLPADEDAIAAAVNVARELSGRARLTVTASKDALTVSWDRTLQPVESEARRVYTASLMQTGSGTPLPRWEEADDWTKQKWMALAERTLRGKAWADATLIAATVRHFEDEQFRQGGGR